MAEKFTIFEADIDIAKATKAVEDSRKAVNELKKGLKELTDAEKINNKALDDQNKLLKSLQESEVKDVKLISETQAGIDKLMNVRDDLNASIVEQTSVLKVNQEELSRNEKQTKNLIVATEAQEGSIKQMKAQLALVTAEWNDLSEEERKNTDAGKSLAKQKLELSNRLREEEKATGSASRSVGFYAEGILEAVAELEKKIKKERENLAVLELVARNNNATKETQEQLKIEIKNTQLALTQANAEIKKYGKNLDITDAEIIDTSIDIDVFNKNTKKSGVELSNTTRQVGFYERATKGLSKAWIIGMGAIASAGAAIKLATGIMNSAQGSGDKLAVELAAINTAWKSVAKAIATWDFDNFVQGIQDAAAAGREYARVLDDLGDRNRAVQVRESALRIEIEKLEQVRDNVLLKNEERIDAAISIADKEEQILKDKEANAKKRFDNETTRLAKLSKLEEKQLLDFIKNYDRTEEARKEAENYTARLKTIGMSFTTLTNLYGDKASEILNRAEEGVKNTSEETKLYAEILKGIGKTTDDELDAIVKAWVELDSTQLEYYTNTERNNKKLNSLIKEKETALTNQQKEQIAKRNKAIAEAKEKQLQDAKAAVDAAIDNLNYEAELFRATQKSKVQGQKQLSQELIDAEKNRIYQQEQFDRDVLEARYAEKLIDANDYDLAVIALQAKTNEEIAALNQQFDEQERLRKLDALQLNYDNELALAESDIFAKLELQRSGLESQRLQELEYAELIGADTSLVMDKYRQMDLDLDRAKEEAKLDMYAGFASNIATIAGETTAVGKAAAATATVINTYKAAMSAFADTPGGVIIKGAAALAATITGIATLKKILATDTNVASGSSGGASISPSTVAPQQALTPQLGSTSVSTQFSTSAAAGAKGVADAQQPVLVTDAVTAKQMQQATNRGISAI